MIGELGSLQTSIEDSARQFELNQKFLWTTRVQDPEKRIANFYTECLTELKIRVKGDVAQLGCLKCLKCFASLRINRSYVDHLNFVLTVQDKSDKRKVDMAAVVCLVPVFYQISGGCGKGKDDLMLNGFDQMQH